jgi:hypothetical protein
MCLSACCLHLSLWCSTHSSAGAGAVLGVGGRYIHASALLLGSSFKDDSRLGSGPRQAQTRFCARARQLRIDALQYANELLILRNQDQLTCVGPAGTLTPGIGTTCGQKAGQQKQYNCCMPVKVVASHHAA